MSIVFAIFKSSYTSILDVPKNKFFGLTGRCQCMNCYSTIIIFFVSGKVGFELTTHFYIVENVSPTIFQNLTALHTLHFNYKENMTTCVSNNVNYHLLVPLTSTIYPKFIWTVSLADNTICDSTSTYQHSTYRNSLSNYK